MLIPLGLLGAIVAIVIVAAFFLQRHFNRCTKEILFWRYAFTKASDKAFESFEEIREDIEDLIKEGHLKPSLTNFSLLGAKRLAELCDDKFEENVLEIDKSAEQRYTETVDQILNDCQRLGFIWVTKLDRTNIVEL